MKFVFLSGGTGTPKLLLGFRRLLDERNITVITNPGDDWEWHGLYVSPDFDTVLYLFADQLDLKKFWGVKNDTFNALDVIKSLGGIQWFHIGDKDLGLHLWRSYLLSQGKSLTEISELIRKQWGIKALILPPTNGIVRTKIITSDSVMDFQEFWVKNKGRPEIVNIFYEKKNARITPIVKKELLHADAIIIGPSNPISSITPILEVNEMREILSQIRTKVIAVSPFIGQSVFSGPAAKMMIAKGLIPSSEGLAKYLGEYLGSLIIHSKDHTMIKAISKFVPRVIATDTYLDTAEKQLNLAKIILGLLNK